MVGMTSTASRTVRKTTLGWSSWGAGAAAGTKPLPSVLAARVCLRGGVRRGERARGERGDRGGGARDRTARGAVARLCVRCLRAGCFLAALMVPLLVTLGAARRGLEPARPARGRGGGGRLTASSPGRAGAMPSCDLAVGAGLGRRVALFCAAFDVVAARRSAALVAVVVAAWCWAFACCLAACLSCGAGAGATAAGAGAVAACCFLAWPGGSWVCAAGDCCWPGGVAPCFANANMGNAPTASTASTTSRRPPLVCLTSPSSAGTRSDTSPKSAQR